MSLQRPLARFARLAVFAAVATAGAAPSRADEPGIPWREDYASAFEEARASGRPLWIQFTGAWCPNCVRMERETFPSPAVVARANSQFVPVRLPADAHEELAASFELTGLPASVVVAPDRRVLAAHQGYLGPDDLDALLAGAVAARAPRSNAEDLADAPRPASEFVGPPRATEGPAELSGYCPVNLVEGGGLVPGRAECAAEFGGRVYRLADAEALGRFRRDPERYLPANDGRCPVERLDANVEIPGDLRFAALYRDRLYLCASEDDRARFAADPERYAAAGVESGGLCPHCLAERGEAVPGDPRFSLALGARRFWFPNLSHRDAFLSLAPSRLLRR